MSLSAQDIVALARAGFNAAQIGAINEESTLSTETTVSTESTDLSTESPTVQEAPVENAEKAADQLPIQPVQAEKVQPQPEQPAGPSVSDLMAKLQELEKTFQRSSIFTDKIETPDPLTGADVLARILDPTENN